MPLRQAAREEETARAPNELAVFPLDCPEGWATVRAAGAADLDISRRDAGPDLRRHRIEMAPPDIDPIAVVYDAGPDSALHGEQMIASGPRDEVLAVLERAGYTFAAPPTWVVEYREPDTSRWWIVSAHSRESKARAMLASLRAGGFEKSRAREIPA